MNSRWRNLTLWVFSYLSFLLASMNEKFTCMKALISKGCIFISFVSFPCNGEQSPEEGNLRVRCAPLSLLQLLWETNRMVDTCLAPRRLSLDENVRAKEGGKETTGETSFRRPSLPFPWSLAVHHQSLVFRARLYDAKNEAPEEKAGSTHYFMINSQLF